MRQSPASEERVAHLWKGLLDCNTLGTFLNLEYAELISDSAYSMSFCCLYLPFFFNDHPHKRVSVVDRRTAAQEMSSRQTSAKDGSATRLLFNELVHVGSYLSCLRLSIACRAIVLCTGHR